MNRAIATLPALLSLGCFESQPDAEPVPTAPTPSPVAQARAAAPTAGMTPIYVTVGAHLENKLPLPCAQAGCQGHCKDAFLKFRGNVLQYAELMQRYGASYNVQTNWHMIELEDACVDDATRTATTKGKHVLVYLMEDLGAMIDPHAHEQQIVRYDTSYNYADIMQLIADQGVPAETLSVVGGCIAGSDYQWEHFAGGYAGNHYPQVRWTPRAFTFPAVHDHDPAGEDFTSGMWRPSAFDWEPAAGRQGEGYYSDDPSGAYAMIGSGYLHHCAGGYPKGDFWVASDYIEVLAQHIATGKAPGGRLYTSTVAMNQRHFKDPDTYLSMMELQLQALQPLVESGQVVYAHFQELPDIWESQYASQPNLYRYDNIDPADYTCDGHGNGIGKREGQRMVMPQKGKGAKQRPAQGQRTQGQAPRGGGGGKEGGGGKKGGGGKR